MRLKSEAGHITKPSTAEISFIDFAACADLFSCKKTVLLTIYSLVLGLAMPGEDREQALRQTGN